MNFFRQTDRRTLLLWSVLLSLALLCSQGIKLHVHNLDHGYDEHANDSLSDSPSNSLSDSLSHDRVHKHAEVVNKTGYHGHLSKAHFTHDTSHDDHDGMVYDVNINPYGLLKNTNNNPFVIALFSLFFTLVIVISTRQRVQRCRENKLVLHRFYVLSPPLRAPPLH